MKKHTVILFLTAVMLFCLSACSFHFPANRTDSTADASNQSADGSAEKTADTDVTSAQSNGGSDEAWNPYVAQRQVLLDEGSMCGVIYIGNVEANAIDITENRAYYQQILKNSGYAEDFDFIMNIPDSNFVSTQLGRELYVIIPYDENASVMVNQWVYDWETDSGKTVGILHAATNGSPLLLKCNASETMPDTELVILDTEGQMLRWNPCIDQTFGQVSVYGENKREVHDFTVYG